MEFERHTEFDVRKACNEYLNTGKLRASARHYGIPYATLRRRLLGRLPKVRAYSDRQRLSLVQEEHLSKWILL